MSYNNGYILCVESHLKFGTFMAACGKDRNTHVRQFQKLLHVAIFSHARCSWFKPDYYNIQNPLFSNI